MAFRIVLLSVLAATPAFAESYVWTNVRVVPDDLIATPWGWSNIRQEDPGEESYRIAAEDFVVARPVRITRITFWSGEVGEPWILGGDWYVYTGGSLPGTLLAGAGNIPMEHTKTAWTNAELGPIFVNHMRPEVLVLSPGTYFLGFRTFQKSNPSGKNNNAALSTVWQAAGARALWNFGVLGDGSVTLPWRLLSEFNLVTDNEWSFEVAGFVLGDVNCDSQVNFADINPFVLALSDPAGYAAAFPDCSVVAGDINGDGRTDFLDISWFVALLAS